jgi:hypothetical protein
MAAHSDLARFRQLAEQMHPDFYTSDSDSESESIVLLLVLVRCQNYNLRLRFFVQHQAPQSESGAPE